MYRSMYEKRPGCFAWPTTTTTNKVDAVCEKLMSELEMDGERFLLPIVSCIVKSSRSDVAGALQRIEQIRGS